MGGGSMMSIAYVVSVRARVPAAAGGTRVFPPCVNDTSSQLPCTSCGVMLGWVELLSLPQALASSATATRKTDGRTTPWRIGMDNASLAGVVNAAGGRFVRGIHDTTRARCAPYGTRTMGRAFRTPLASAPAQAVPSTERPGTRDAARRARSARSATRSGAASETD